MKNYSKLVLSTIAEESFKEKKSMSLNEAEKNLGPCSLTAVSLKNDEGNFVDKDRVWMSVGGGVWTKTSIYAPVSTVKGYYENLPVIRAEKFEKAVAMTVDEAKKVLGVCSLAKVALCNNRDEIVMSEGEVAVEVVWLSFSGTYWARVGGFVDENIGIVL